MDYRLTGAGIITLNAAFHTGLAVRLHEYFGEELYCHACDFGGSTIVHSEFPSGSTGIGWHDPTQQNYWAPTEGNACFQRLLDELDAAVTAAAAAGDTLECVGIVWAQGESDGLTQQYADRYAENARLVRTTLRNAIKSRSMFSGSAEKIPWIHPRVLTGVFTYASTINEQIQILAEEDPYTRTFDVSDLTATDTLHYDDDSIQLLERRCYDAIVDIRRATSDSGAVAICNLALSHIGDASRVTSIDPVDGSAQSTHCARFYPIARDSLLEMRQWSFAMKRKVLIELDESDVTEWDYAYLHPADALSIISVQPEDATDDYVQPSIQLGFTPTPVMGSQASFSNVGAPFSVEIDSLGRKVIYTDLPDAAVRYVSRASDATKYPQTFVIALAWKLASMLAGAIIKGEQGAAESKRCLQMLMAHLGPAESKDAQQSKADVPHVPPWISARG